MIKFMKHFKKSKTKHQYKEKQLNNSYIIQNRVGNEPKYYQNNFNLVSAKSENIVKNSNFYFSQNALKSFSDKMTKNFGKQWKKSIKFISLKDFVISQSKPPKPTCAFIGKNQCGEHFFNQSENNIDFDFKQIAKIKRFLKKYSLPKNDVNYLKDLQSRIDYVTQAAYMDYFVYAVNPQYVQLALNYCQKMSDFVND